MRRTAACPSAAQAIRDGRLRATLVSAEGQVAAHSMLSSVSLPTRNGKVRLVYTKNHRLSTAEKDFALPNLGLHTA